MEVSPEEFERPHLVLMVAAAFAKQLL